ncbi:MAG: hypothetical protein HY234_00860 [Acidobacteria bacterium]|nr:hypothetical protein [Acidobacteriota bacterium]
MRFLRFAAILLLITPLSVFGQGTPVRDQRAVDVLQRLLVVFGSTLPGDYTASGTLTVYAGGSEDSGTIRILGKGLRQYREEITVGGQKQELTFAALGAKVTDGLGKRPISPANAESMRGAIFPLTRIASDLVQATTGVEYLGLEGEKTAALHHLRIRTASFLDEDPKEAGTSVQTETEVWIDATTYLPRKISFNVFAEGAPKEPIPMEVVYTAWANFGGAPFPIQVEKHLNGTLLSRITIQSVAINSGLTDAQFSNR